MKEYLEHIVFYRDFSPEQTKELQELIATDSDAAALFREWQSLLDSLARHLDESVPDRHLFALYMLREHGHQNLLTDEERRRVENAAPSIREALSQHPGLDAVGLDIRGAADEFEATWNAWFEAEEEPARRDDGSRHPLSKPYPDRQRRLVRSRAARWSARVAIAAAVVVFAALLVFVIQRDHGMETVETVEGEIKTIYLGGGSTVRLMGSSRLSHTPSDDAAPIGRQVILDGQAFFEIAPTAQGLVVKTRTAQLTVLGTTFGVQAGEAVTEVVLAEGRLSVASREEPARAVVLESGHMTRIGEDANPTEPEAVSVHEHLAWTGLFVFSSTPLDQILQELSRHYDAEVTMADELSGERVTGRFERGQDLEEILRTVVAAIGADLEVLSDGGYRLVPA